MSTSLGMPKVNVDEWLKQNKLSDIADIFKQRDVTIEELIEFEDTDLKAFANDTLKLDTLASSRFLSGIKRLRPKKIEQTALKHKVIISNKEQNAISQLYERYESTTKLQQEIRDSLEQFNGENQCNQKIETIINDLISKINEKRSEVLNDVDKTANDKNNLLSKQVKSLQNYLPTIKNGQAQYDQYIHAKNMNMKQRKKTVLNMVSQIFSDSQISMTLITAPRLQFNINNHIENLERMYSCFDVNDCDQPQPLIANIKKIKFDEIIIQYSLHSLDINSVNNILEIEAECVLMDKNYETKCFYQEKKNKPKRKKKKRRKKKYKSESDSDSSFNSTNSSDSDSDIVSSSNSQSDSENDSNDSYVNDNDNIHWNELKWMKDTQRFKKYKTDNIYKYKIKKILKPKRLYAIRLRARNKSGWSLYSKILILKASNFPKWDESMKNKYTQINKITFIGDRQISSQHSSWSTFVPNRVISGSHCKHYEIEIKWLNSFGTSNSSLFFGFYKAPLNELHAQWMNQYCGQQTKSMKQFGCFIYSSYKYFGLYGNGKSNHKVQYPQASFKAGDKFKLKFNFKKRTAVMYYNGKKVGVVWNNIPKKIIPAVSLRNAEVKALNW
eukprot:163988_1